MRAKALPAPIDLARLVRSIVPDIEDDFYENEGDEPSITLTIGWHPGDGSWGFQTGNIQYMGDAYLYPCIYSAEVYRDTAPYKWANECRQDLKDDGFAYLEEYEGNG